MDTYTHILTHKQGIFNYFLRITLIVAKQMQKGRKIRHASFGPFVSHIIILIE